MLPPTPDPYGFGPAVNDAPAVATAVDPALDVVPGQCRRLGLAQAGVGEDGHQGHVELPPLATLLGRLDATAAPSGLLGGDVAHGEDVGSECAGLALGFGHTPAPSFQRGEHARVPAGRFQPDPLVSL